MNEGVSERWTEGVRRLPSDAGVDRASRDSGTMPSQCSLRRLLEWRRERSIGLGGLLRVKDRSRLARRAVWPGGMLNQTLCGPNKETLR